VTSLPPPPPPPPRSAQTFDFARPFAFVFEDPEWVQKMLLGGVFMLASVVIVGIFFVYGYFARLVRNVIDGVQYPLPSWDDLGDYFMEGLRLFAVCMVYLLPIIGLAMMFIFPAMLAEVTNNETFRDASDVMTSCLACVMAPVGLLLAVWLPAALLMAVVDRRFGAAFEFGRIWNFLKANAGNYVLAYIAWLVARFIVPLGFVLCCIGIVFVLFWSFCVGAYSFGQTYRLSLKR
jgi:hypothetical protein